MIKHLLPQILYHPLGNNNLLRKPLPEKLLLQFCQQLSLLLNAKIVLLQALNILIQQCHHPRQRKWLQQLAAGINRGLGLTQACEQSTIYRLPTSVLSLFAIGEQTGKLSHVLAQCAKWYKEKQLLQRSIKQALFYPLVLLTTSLAMLVTLLLWVVPQFTDLFHSMNQELPWLTRYLLQLTQQLQQYGGHLLVAISIVCCVILYCWQRLPNVRLLLEKTIYRCPGLGTSLRQQQLAKLTQVLALLLSAEVAILESWRLAQETCQSILYQTVCHQIQIQLQRGQTLFAAMRTTQAFPSGLLQLIQTGEQTHSLSTLFEHASQEYQQACRQHWALIAQCLEPLLLFGLGGCIGIIVLAMYLPIFSMGELF